MKVVSGLILLILLLAPSGLVIAGVPPEDTGFQATVVPTLHSKTPVRNPEQFTFHLDSFNRSERPITFTCGTPFSLPQGSFFAWVEGPNLISNRMILHGPGNNRGGPSHRVLQVEVGPAGGALVAASNLEGLPESAHVRFLSTSAHRHDGYLSLEFARICSQEVAITGVQMPIGMAVVAIFDPLERKYLGLSRPAKIVMGQTTKLYPSAPDGGQSHLIVRLERSEPPSEGSGDDVEILVVSSDQGNVIPPDLVVPARDRIYAVWYDLDPGEATVTTRSEGFTLPNLKIELRSGEISDAASRLEMQADSE